MCACVCARVCDFVWACVCVCVYDVDVCVSVCVCAGVYVNDCVRGLLPFL